MTYQVVASHRTGSTLLNSFCIDYNELTVSNLQKFFNTQYKPDTIPHNIDYTKFVSNLEDVREYFNECIFHPLRFK